jgi:hypothetical protein
VNDLLGEGVLTQAQADALLGPGNILQRSVTRRKATGKYAAS